MPDDRTRQLAVTLICDARDQPDAVRRLVSGMDRVDLEDLVLALALQVPDDVPLSHLRRAS